MNQDITDLVANCETCITFRNCHQKETLIQHEIPPSPWIKVGTDVFHLKDKHYLIIVDYHSKFFQVSLLPDTYSSTVIKKTNDKNMRVYVFSNFTTVLLQLYAQFHSDSIQIYHCKNYIISDCILLSQHQIPAKKFVQRLKNNLHTE